MFKLKLITQLIQDHKYWNFFPNEIKNKVYSRSAMSL